MTHPTRAFSGSIINRFTGSKILARVGQISVAFPILFPFCDLLVYYMTTDSYSTESKLWKVDESDTSKLNVFFTSEHFTPEDIARYAKSLRRGSSPRLSYVTNFIELSEELRLED